MSRISITLVALCAFLHGAAEAQSVFAPESLTAERVVALARERAPGVRAAEGRVAEARGRLASARMPATENPRFEGVATDDRRFERRTQWELDVPLGLGPGWLARTGMARAELASERHRLADARRGAVGEALAAYYRVLHAARRAALAAERRDVARELFRAADERHRAGDAPRLERLLAETEELRAAGELAAEEQALARARLALASALALPFDARAAVAGDLGDRRLLDGVLGAPAPAERADVLAAERELSAARAARSLAATEWLPGLSFRLDYGHEGGEPLARPGLAVTLPLFQHGQASGAAARAREAQAAAALERVRDASRTEARTLELAYAEAARAADAMGARALPLLDESEGLVRESYRAGKIALPELLVVRRELLEARRETLDRMLDAALAGIDLAVARGHFQ